MGYKTKEEALFQAGEAKQIIEKRCGKKWKRKVWETDQWYFDFIKGPIRLQVEGNAEDGFLFWCMIEVEDVSNIEWEGEEEKEVSDPRKAINSKVKKFKKHYRKIQDAMAECTEVVLDFF